LLADVIRDLTDSCCPTEAVTPETLIPKGSPMKPPATVIALLILAFALILAPARAEAQVPIPYGSWVDYGGTIVYSPGFVPSYSYWTAAYYGYPPRSYVGYGSGYNDFPYYGRPYGSPSDPWSWPAMAGYPNGVPSRFNLWLP